MLTLVVRRALVQRRLVAAVVLLTAVAAGLVGVCSLLLGVTQARAFHEEVQRAQPQDVDVTAFLVEVPAADLVDAREQARSVVRDVLAPLRPTVSSTANARMRRLDDDELGYLATTDTLAERAELTAGRWVDEEADGPPEAVVPQTTARLLGLSLGDRVTFGSEIAGGVDDPVTVVVVGTFRPTVPAGWEGDTLDGDGFDPGYSDGTTTAPAYGPFVVGDAAFLASGSSVSGLRVTAHPTLARADEASLRAAVDSLDEASGLLSARVEDRARITRVASDLPRTLDRIDAQQASTRATVLVVLLLGTALSLAAALLAGRLVAAVRDEERTLLAAFGQSRRQQLGAALLESLLLAVTAALLAVPAAAVVHSRLTHLPDLRAAGLTQSPTLTWGLVLAVLAGSVVVISPLVLTVIDADSAPDPTARRWAVVRSGVDVLLLAVAAVAWWQLRSQPATAATSGDVTLTVAPVLCVAAVTLVAVRLVPVLLAAAARAGVRSRGLVLPLAAQQAARRPHAGTAMVLVAAAVAAAVFGMVLRATWERSQDDQAALRVGTDVTLTLADPAGPREAAAVASVTGGGDAPVVSVAIDRPLALGSFVGDLGSRPVLVAVDTTSAGALLSGRLDPGTTWAGVGAELAPDAPVQGIALPEAGTGVELEGRAPAGAGLTATPTAVVQDASGLRWSVSARPVPLDGRAHRLRWLGTVGDGLDLVAVRLDLDGNPVGAAATDPAAEVSVTLRVPGREPTTAADWTALSLLQYSPIQGTTLAVTPTDDSTELKTTATVDLVYFAYTGASMLATSFPAPADVPVVVSQELADAVGTTPGDELSAIVDGTALVLRVTAVVPTVPSAPGQVAVLADADTVSRALIDAGRLDPVVDGWWAADPTPETVRALRALEIGDVTTRQEAAASLAQGPVRVAVPTALETLVAAAVVLLLAGVGLVVSADRRRRTEELARWRAIGLARRDARRLVVAEHVIFLVPLVLAGALVGLATAAALAPHLVRSDVGAAPIPEAVVAWPWAGLGLLVGGLLLGSWVVTVLLAALQVRRANPARLRAGDGS